MSKPVKMEWCIILWRADRWEMIPDTKNKSFQDHKVEFQMAKAVYPIDHVKSIHVCWLDDIANWDPPKEEFTVNPASPIVMTETLKPEDIITGPVVPEREARKKFDPGPFFNMGANHTTRRLDEEVAKLCPHDRREYRRYLKYLELRAKYGEKTLMARPFWRKYLGLE